MEVTRTIRVKLDVAAEHREDLHSTIQQVNHAANYTIGAPWTGVLVTVDEVGVPLSLPHLLGAVGVAAAAGAALVVTVGDRYLTVVGRFDATWLSAGVLALLAAVSYLFAGWVGVVVYLAATVVRLVPARFHARRANLMGVLMGPLIVG